MGLRERIGIDIGRKLPLEDAIAWAAANAVRFIDVQLDTGANRLGTLDARRTAALRESAERQGIRLGLHTASAVNVAEYAPYVGDAVDEYLKAYVDAAQALGAGWVVMHAGFHFTSDRDARMRAGLERLQRVVAHAEHKGVLILLENLNKEPEEAEVHYLAHTVEEWRFYYKRIQSRSFRLSFTVNHAHLVPAGIAGFVDALDFAQVEEVRLADCWRGGHEVHLAPGRGDIDFADMFRRVEGAGFTGHYMNAFGSLDDMLLGRETLLSSAAAAAIA